MTLGPPDEDGAKVVKARILAALEAARVEIGTAQRYKGGAPVGDPVPAITVRDWPEGITVKGLEVIIAPNPKLKTVPGFEFLGWWRTWPVKFINRAGQSDILERAANAVASALWPLDDEPVIIPESRDFPEQIILGVNVDQRD